MVAPNESTEVTVIIPAAAARGIKQHDRIETNADTSRLLNKCAPDSR